MPRCEGDGLHAGGSTDPADDGTGLFLKPGKDLTMGDAERTPTSDKTAIMQDPRAKRLFDLIEETAGPAFDYGTTFILFMTVHSSEALPECSDTKFLTAMEEAGLKHATLFAEAEQHISLSDDGQPLSVKHTKAAEMCRITRQRLSGAQIATEAMLPSPANTASAVATAASSEVEQEPSSLLGSSAE